MSLHLYSSVMIEYMCVHVCIYGKCVCVCACVCACVCVCVCVCVCLCERGKREQEIETGKKKRLRQKDRELECLCTCMFCVHTSVFVSVPVVNTLFAPCLVSTWSSSLKHTALFLFSASLRMLKRSEQPDRS